jgi:hypothetical protein
MLLLAVLCLLALSKSSRSQIAPFGTEWDYRSCPGNRPGSWYIISTEIEVDGYRYSQLDGTWSYSLSLDSNVLYQLSETNERKRIFDFNAQVGDTMIVDLNLNSRYPKWDRGIIIIDSIFLDEYDLRTFCFHIQSSSRRLFFTEKVFKKANGMTLTELIPRWTSSDDVLCSYIEPGLQMDSFCNDVMCLHLGNEELKILEESITFYPLPANKELSMHFPSEITPQTIFIYDQWGDKVGEQTIASYSEHLTITTSSW